MTESEKMGPPEAAMDPHGRARVYMGKHATDGKGRHTLHYWRGEWYRWSDGRYQTVSTEELNVELMAAIKREVDEKHLIDRHGKAYRVTRALVTNVRQALAGYLQVPEDVELPVWLGLGKTKDFFALGNGLVGVDAALEGLPVLRPHSPEWFSMVRFPFGFDPAATCPNWTTFLSEVLEDDNERIAVLQEYFGVCLTPDTSFHKFLLLEGEGANGKSVAIDVLGALLGEDNVSHVPLEVFGERFQLTPTLNKLANIAPEADENSKVNIGMFKQFVAGDRTYFDRKGLSGLQARPTARVVVATNSRPRFLDRSQGLWRRMLLIPFRVRIPVERQDRELSRKLRDELPGIFNWALEGLLRLRKNNRFTESAIGLAARKEYERESNPAALFLAEECMADADERETVDNLFNVYRAWCHRNGFAALNAAEFGKEVRKAFPTVARRRISEGGIREYFHVGMLLQRPEVKWPAAEMEDRPTAKATE